MSNNNDNLLILARLFSLIGKNFKYVSKKYISVPLKINYYYNKINSNDIVKIKMVPSKDYKVGNVDDSFIESIEYYANIVFNFIETIEKKFPKETLSNFYNNINSITIEEVKQIIGKKDATGFYDFFYNKIGLKENQIASIYHELFHMSSTRKVGKVYYCGFAIYDKDDSYGIGLNEGYTQLMTERYFENDRTLNFLERNYGIINHKHAVGKSYSLQTFIAFKVEQIIGKDKMEKMYLNANPYGLREELMKYASKAEINKFILNLDFLHYNIADAFRFSVNSKKIYNAYVQICAFLFNCYKKKVVLEHGKYFVYRKDFEKEYINDFEKVYDAFFSYGDTNNINRKK